MNSTRLRLLYDGACPICRRAVDKLRAWDPTGDRIEMVDISAPDFRASDHGVEPEAVRGALHAVLPDGRIVRGMDAVHAAYRAVGRGWRLAPTRWVPLRGLFDALYRWIARNRHALSRWCCRAGPP